MSITTAPMLLDHAERLARDLMGTETAMTRHQWESFDNTVYQLLHALVGPERRMHGGESQVGRAVLTTFQAYPSPLRPGREEIYSAVSAARFLGHSHAQLIRDVRSGAIMADRTEREFRIHAAHLDTRPDLTPASSTDRHPVARLSVALGAFNDLLASTAGGGDRRLNDDVQIAAAIRHVLSIAYVVARHALAHSPIADADRPLRVAQYAERGVDALAGPDGYPLLWERVAVSPPRSQQTLNDRLELALSEWTQAGRDDLKFQVPSTDVIRNIASTGVHILAATDALLAKQLDFAPSPMQTVDRVRTNVEQTARSLNDSAAAWRPLTTGMSPSHRYISSSQSLFAALRETQEALKATSEQSPSLNVQHALLNLQIATRELSLRMALIDSLSRRLLDSGLLFVRARSIRPTPEVLNERAKGRLVPAGSQDVVDLANHMRESRKYSLAVSEQLREHMLSMNVPSLGRRATSAEGPQL